MYSIRLETNKTILFQIRMRVVCGYRINLNIQKKKNHKITLFEKNIVISF